MDELYACPECLGSGEYGSKKDQFCRECNGGGYVDEIWRICQICIKVVRSMAHRVLVMQTGKVVEAGGAQSLFDSPSEPYTKALLKAATELAVDDSAAVRQ